MISGRGHQYRSLALHGLYLAGPDSHSAAAQYLPYGCTANFCV